MKEEKLMPDRRKGTWKKYWEYGLTAFLVIGAAVLLIFMFVKGESFAAFWGRISKAMAPVVIGAILAYLMNPIMRFFENRLKPLFYKRAKHINRAKKAVRVISIIITLLCVFLVIFFLMYLLIPELITTGKSVYDSFASGEMIRNVTEWYRGLHLEESRFSDVIETAFDKGTAYLNDFVENKLVDTVTKVLGSVAAGVVNAVGVVYNVVVGLIFSVYMLGAKEKLIATMKKILYAVFKRRKANTFLRIGRACHHKFIDSITGKSFDSVIIGLMCFVLMYILDLPYKTLVSVVVGVTNVIPFFGPFIGAIPSALLIFFVSPVQCLYFLIMIFALQQFDGNYLTPKIVGDSIGLSPLWVLFACTVFGSLWGVLGMLIGMPLMGCIYMIIKEIVEDRLHKRGLMIPTEDYLELDSVDETEVFCRVVEVPDETAAGEGQAEPVNAQPGTAKAVDGNENNDNKK